MNEFIVSFADTTKLTVTARDKFEAWDKAVADGSHSKEDVVSIELVEIKKDTD